MRQITGPPRMQRAHKQCTPHTADAVASQAAGVRARAWEAVGAVVEEAPAVQAEHAHLGARDHLGA